jgi:hypothetical protein
MTLIKENFINFIVDIYNMDGEYKNLDKRLQEQNSRHGKEKPSGLMEFIYQILPSSVEQDPCKIPGYVCIPERKFRRGTPFPMPIVKPDPDKENDRIYKPLPLNPNDKPEQGKYHLLPLPRIEPDPNKDIVKEGYVYIPGWEGYIPIKLPVRVPEDEIEKYRGIVPVRDPESKCRPKGVYWIPEREPDCSRPGEYVLTPGVGYIWIPPLKPKFDFFKYLY